MNINSLYSNTISKPSFYSIVLVVMCLAIGLVYGVDRLSAYPLQPAAFLESVALGFVAFFTQLFFVKGLKRTVAIAVMVGVALAASIGVYVWVLKMYH